MNLFRPLAPQAQAPAHGESLVLDGHVIRFRVDARARRISLRIDQANRQVIATAPTPRALADALIFAESRAVWIAGQMARLPAPSSLAPGGVISVLGQPCRLEAGQGRARLVEAVDDEPMRIIAPDNERYAGAVLRLLKARARDELVQATEIHARALNQPIPVVTLGDPRGRWGSCRPARKRGLLAGIEVGRIRYSWRLILTPPEVLDYVAAHECAHLIEANHGPNFWALVSDLVGDERPHRKWLRSNGSSLHAFGRG